MRILVLNPPSKYTKNVVRDLIYGCWCKGKRIGGAKIPPLNLLYIATILKQNKFYTIFKDGQAEGMDFTELQILALGVDIVIISTSNMTFKEDMGCLYIMKMENPNLKTIIFGSYPTFETDKCLEHPLIDYIIIGEPEFAILELLKSFNNNVKPNSKVHQSIINNLDLLPIPDRTLLSSELDYFNPLIKRMPYTTTMTSRGCPGLCTFCNVPKFYGKKYRAMSAKRVIKEIEEIIALGYKEIWFRDETFTAFPQRNLEICEYIIKNKLDITWIANARSNMITKQMMATMKKAGCHTLKFGVESGVQSILDNVKKGITLQQTRRCFKWAEEIGMNTHAHVMLGMPGETEDTIKKTIKFVKDIKPTTVTFGICTPYPGTTLFDQLPEKIDGTDIELDSLHTDARYNEQFTSLSKEKLEKYVKKAYREFYFRPSYIIKKLMSINSMDELRRLIIAGSKVFEFGVGK